MKEFNMLVWLTQLGFSVAMPLAGFTLIGFWLKEKFGLGIWIVLCGCVLGLICAVSGLKNALKIMEQMDKKNEKQDPLPVSFNEHD